MDIDREIAGIQQIYGYRGDSRVDSSQPTPTEDLNFRRKLGSDTQHNVPWFNMGANPTQAMTCAAKASRTVGQLRAAIKEIEQEFGHPVTTAEVTAAMRKSGITPLVSALDELWHNADSRRLLGN